LFQKLTTLDRWLRIIILDRLELLWLGAVINEGLNGGSNTLVEDR
jgi:hypothetical protein